MNNGYWVSQCLSHGPDKYLPLAIVFFSHFFKLILANLCFSERSFNCSLRKNFTVFFP